MSSSESEPESGRLGKLYGNLFEQLSTIYENSARLAVAGHTELLTKLFEDTVEKFRNKTLTEEAVLEFEVISVYAMRQINALEAAMKVLRTRGRHGSNPED